MASGIPAVTSASRPVSTDIRTWSLLGLSERRLFLLAATAFINVVLAVMGDLLFLGGSRVFSAAGGGVDARFASLRSFTAGTLAEGQLPLWNPTLLAGIPHLGSFESGLYYPTTLLYRVLPLPVAVNAGIAVHLFVFGMLTFVWLRRHGIHPFASIYGGVAAMLSGVYFLHAGMGDLTVLEAFTWTPAALIAIHGLSRGHLAAGALGGTVSLTMQVLCGYPMAAFYTGLAGLIYGGCLFAGAANRGTMIRGGLIVFTAVPLLTSIQLMPGLETFFRSVRFQGDGLSNVASKAIAGRDFLTAVAPWGEGSAAARPTANIFVGVMTLAAAAYGIVWGTGRFRLVSLTSAIALLFLASLPGLPVYTTLMDAAPPLRYVLESNLFAIPAMLFVIAAGCVGFDQLIRTPESASRMARVAIALAVVICAGALMARVMFGESDGMVRGLLAAGGVMFCGGALLSLVPVNAWFRFAVVGLGIVELYVFAVVNRPSMPLETGASVVNVAGDERVLNLQWRNPAADSGTPSASGNIALPSRRYMGLLAQTQQSDLPEHWEGPFAPVGYHPLHRMLRVGNVVSPEGPVDGVTVDDALPRFVLLDDFVVAPNREEAFAAMNDPAFDPWQTVVLEREPSPLPRGEVDQIAIEVSDETDNGLTLEMTLEQPALLLMTDAYDPGWRAYGLTGSSQWRYDVLPANVALRAIPLGAGAHRMRLTYSPLTFRAGRWISLPAAAALMLFAVAAMWRRQRVLAGTA